MKSQNTILALLISATLLTAGAGCKKSPKPPTLIPGSRPTVAENTGPIKPAELPQAPNRGNVTPGNPLGGDNGLNTRPLTGNDPNAAGNNNLTSAPLTNPEDAGKQDKRPPGDLPEDNKVLAAETVHFDYDRATVKASERPKLDRVSAYLKSKPNVFLRVEGNCDERGTEDYNRSLGERRALSAREYLVNSGIAPDRITTVTYGEDKPADPGHDETAWAKNRRADFIVLGDISTGTQ